MYPEEELETDACADDVEALFVYKGRLELSQVEYGVSNFAVLAHKVQL